MLMRTIPFAAALLLASVAWGQARRDTMSLAPTPTATAPAVATLAGWFDGDSAGGRMKVEGRADGRWTATRKP